MHPLRPVLFLLAGLVVACSETRTGALCEAGEGTKLYDERIDPLFRDEQPSSCNQCHLTGLDLRQYVRSSPCETFSCLVDLGLVDTATPRESTVLTWIKRAQPDSELITQNVIDAEYDAFLEWITYNSQCSECSGVPCSAGLDGGSFCSDDFDFAQSDAGNSALGCSEDALAQAFRATVYRNRGRCAPCHINEPDHEKYQAPLWIEVQTDCETASLRTLDNVLHAGYLDTRNPQSSLLLLKPLAERHGGVVHGGHDKFDGMSDPGYEAFLSFIEHLAACEHTTDAGH